MSDVLHGDALEPSLVRVGRAYPDDGRNPMVSIEIGDAERQTITFVLTAEQAVHISTQLQVAATSLLELGLS